MRLTKEEKQEYLTNGCIGTISICNTASYNLYDIIYDYDYDYCLIIGINNQMPKAYKFKEKLDKNGNVKLYNATLDINSDDFMRIENKNYVSK